MINLSRYQALLDAIAHATTERELLEKFQQNGGKFKLSIVAEGQPDVSAVLNRIYSKANGFDFILNSSLKSARSREENLSREFLNETTGDAVAASVQEAAE